MPVKHARHIALTAPLAVWVDEQMALGEYTSASDLIRTALRQMQERDVSKPQVTTKQLALLERL